MGRRAGVADVPEGDVYIQVLASELVKQNPRPRYQRSSRGPHRGIEAGTRGRIQEKVGEQRRFQKGWLRREGTNEVGLVSRAAR